MLCKVLSALVHVRIRAVLQKHDRLCTNQQSDDVKVTITDAVDYLSDLRYHVMTPRHSLTAQRGFKVTPSTLTRLGFPLTDFTKDVEHLVFVTGADAARYFHIDMDAIAIVQRMFPTNLIYFYDLAVADRSSKQVDQVRTRSLPVYFFSLSDIRFVLFGKSCWVLVWVTQAMLPIFLFV